MAGYRGNCCKTPKITSKMPYWASVMTTEPRNTLAFVPQLELFGHHRANAIVAADQQAACQYCQSQSKMRRHSIIQVAVTRGMSEWIALFVTVYQWPGALPSLYTATSVGPQDLSWVPHTTL
jgi:hypothetical protein